MAELKTLLFTDIVRSVDLKGEMPGYSDSERDLAYIEQILMPHRQRIDQRLAELGGRVVSTAGDGHFLVFADTISAARWAVEIQRSHRDEPIRTPKGNTVEVRISMHLGVPQVDPDDANNFIGKPVDYAARLSDYATGGQILASKSVVSVLEDSGIDGVSFHAHGRRELKGIGRVDVFELVYDGGGPHTMRNQPRESFERQWTVLPATMGLTAFRDPPYREGVVRAGRKESSQSSKASTDVVPLRLGNYELDERLGSGGMGDVFRARHSQFGRVRAVKVIKQQFVDAGHDEVIRRFYQEIKAVGALEHPNIVVAIDSSAPTDSVHYLVMEYIDGVAADELVARRGPLSVADACEVARQAARGLVYIQQHGMVHRDIKPSNLMLTLVRGETTGSDTQADKVNAADQVVVKILDLGLALLVGDDQQRLTVFDNRAMGTAMYMSPEQWKTSSVDIRADIYSLGCTLYHLLAGKPPFWESDLKPEKAHEREQLPPIAGGEPIPPAMWDVLRRMTAKNPAERFGSPAEVVAALTPLAAGNQLAEVVRGISGGSPRSRTHAMARTETLIAKSAESDTRNRTRAGTMGEATLSQITRQKARKFAMVVLTLAAVAGIGWLAWQATARRESAEEALRARQHTLEVAAKFAASEILKEIKLRFDTLQRIADDSELQQQMVEIKSRPSDMALWKKLDNWLGARKADNDRKVSSESWFITDWRGTQVARSPRSETTGESFAHRDYFHGRGADLAVDTKDLKPISEQHLSAVYRSKSTGHLKVAFSVPIENGKRGKAREVVGVLAMSVDLGDFSVLEKELPDGHEVVLIDLREATLDGQTRRGLILHHQSDESYREGEAPPWVSGELMGQIEKVLAADSAKSESSEMLPPYRDDALTNGRLYWGSIQPVIDRGPDGTLDFRWLVLVQEPMRR